MRVTSCQNPKIKGIRALSRRKERQQSEMCVIEGLHLCRAAARNGVPFETLVVCPERVTRPPVQEFVETLRSKGVPLLEVTPDVLDSLAVRENAQGIVGVVRQRWATLDQLPTHAPHCFVALEGVQYPGNLGTIVRTADAVGCGGIILLDNATDPYDPASLRASRGAVFSQALVRVTSEEFARWRERHRLPLVGATPSASQDYRTTAYPLPLVLLMGGERSGLSAGIESLCTTTVRIPMVGQCDSLNLAVSTAVLLYAIYDQHQPP